jgi:hypothetical protein
MSYYIFKGSKRVDSFYLNEMPIKFVHYLNKTKKEVDLEVDEFGFFQRVVYNRMFPIRLNSCIWFPTEKEGLDYISNAINSVSLDDRFSSSVKDSLVSYLGSFKVSSF